MPDMRTGDLVLLRPVTEVEDIKVIIGWMESAAGVYSAGTTQSTSVENLKQELTSESSGMYMVRTRDGEDVGAVSWKLAGFAGNYEVGNIVGSPDLWGAGYGVESVMLLVEHLFHAWNAHRVQMKAGTYNKAMMQIFVQGFLRIEGVLRDFFFVDGEYHHAVIASLLRDEYYGLTDVTELEQADVVPREEKKEGHRLLEEHLASHPITG